MIEIPHQPGQACVLTNRDALRQATRMSHVRAESRWFSTGSFPSRAVYDEWLSALLMAHAILGKSATHDEALKHYSKDETRRRNALLTDLGEQKRQVHLPAQKSESWSWGVLYALNGSALGSSTLLKSGAVRADWPKHYVEEMGRFATSGQLKAFFVRLNTVNLNHIEMISGANSVFDMLAQQGSVHSLPCQGC